MKFKEIESTSNVVWSPQSFYPVMLATGSAAQHVDSSFSSSATLELYSLNLNDPGYEMEQKASISSEHKFQKLVWSSGGVLVGGCDGGLLKFYSVNNLLNKKEALVSSNTKHNGSVSALDLNPFQNNLFSSGAADSEIYIWDLNNTTTPMAPGNKSHPHEHVQSLAWNRQVQHILASSFASRCVVWDLRKNEPIIKLSDGQARTRWKSAVWHPSVATQLCLASEDDSAPVVQLWDLRLATSPLLTLERHQKGVLSLSWCQQDPDLLLSASRDGKVLCWNPNNNIPGGEVLSEICSTGQWMYDVQWCPRNPNLVAACSNDGRVGIYSINGGLHLQPVATSNKIMDSFPGMENLQQAPVPSFNEIHTSPQILPRPPLWTKRPIRATFGFGGKLVSFINPNTSVSQSGLPPLREVFISQVVTEPELINQARSLQEIINAGENEASASLLTEYCEKRGDQATEQHEKYIWHFLKANFQQNHRTEMLNLLGFKQDDMNNKLNAHFAKSNKRQSNVDGQIDHITERLSGLSRSESSETEAEPSTDTSTDISGIDAAAAFDNIAQANKLIDTTTVKPTPTTKPFLIPMGDDSEGLICQALLSGNLEIAVELCLDSGRTADALLIASTGGNDLLTRTQWRYLSQCSGAISSLSAALLDGNWTDFVSGVAPSGWKAALAAALTHCSPNELYAVCETLGKKLDKETDPTLIQDAIICYLCSASIDDLVKRWQGELEAKNGDNKTFARIAELILVARFAAISRGRAVDNASYLSSFLANYAMKLASQGFFEGALTCLSGAQNQDLINRIQCAMGYAQPFASNVNQTAQRSAPQQAQNQWGAGNRVRTASYSRATPDPYWNNQQSNYQANNINPIQAPFKPEPIPPPIGYMQPMQPAQSMPPQLPSQAPPQQNLQQPPRPPSATSAGIIGKNKYLRDPSVQSGPGSYQPPPIDSQPTFGTRQGYMQPGIPPIQSAYNPMMMNPMQPATNQPFNPTQNYNQVQNVPPPVAPPPNIPLLNPTTVNPSLPPTAMNPPTEMSNGLSNSNFYNNSEMGVEAVPQNYSQGPSGWNDPPVFSSKLQRKTEYVPTAPITHPLFGSNASQHVPLTGPPQYQQEQQPMNQFTQNYGAMPPVQQLSEMIPNNQQQAPPVETVAKPPPAPIQKGPIPEQHIHMQTVFDALRAQCAQAANNPQIKRKLDDVQRKLETLYDMLRENKLSDNAIGILHHVVQLIQGGDYANALATLTSLASGPDFSAVASFLPSLKIMIQTANNSQLYLR